MPAIEKNLKQEINKKADKSDVLNELKKKTDSLLTQQLADRVNKIEETCANLGISPEKVETKDDNELVLSNISNLNKNMVRPEVIEELKREIQDN